MTSSQIADGVLLEHLQLADRGDQRDHDLGDDAEALVLDQFAGGLHDGPHLHVVDLRVGDAQAAAAVAEHRVELVQEFDLVLDGVDR